MKWKMLIFYNIMISMIKINLEISV